MGMFFDILSMYGFSGTCQEESVKNVIRVVLSENLPEARPNLVWRHGALGLFGSMLNKAPQLLVQRAKRGLILRAFDSGVEPALFFGEIKLEGGEGHNGAG